MEKDSNLAVLLEQKFSTERTHILNTDVLELDQEQLRSYDVIIGNIPYEISSPLLFKIWSGKPAVQKFPAIILTIQKEFALRLTAKPGTQEYGRLSAMTQLFAMPRVLKIYPPSAFYPVPKVAHGVIELLSKEEIPEEAFTPSFSKFMIALFNRKNKKVINSLEPIVKKHQLEKLESTLRENELFLKRVRDVEPQECVKLFIFWYKTINVLEN